MLIPLDFRRCFVRSIFLQERHINCLILFGHFRFQIIFQRDCIRDLSEVPLASTLVPRFFNHFWATLYALFTKNLQFLVYAHIKELFKRWGLMEIPRITSALWGRNECLTLSTSHDLVVVSSRQATLSDSKWTLELTRNPVWVSTYPSKCQHAPHFQLTTWTLVPQSP